MSDGDFSSPPPDRPLGPPAPEHNPADAATSAGDAAGTHVCPYCGHASTSAVECERCKGLFEPLSRQASQNGMGPWFVRDEQNPFMPGCSLPTLRRMIARGRLGLESVVRGPSTGQFWLPARRVPGVANLLGVCHSCQVGVLTTSTQCPRCGASFAVSADRQSLGLGAVRLLPGQANAEQVASSALGLEPAEKSKHRHHQAKASAAKPAQDQSPEAQAARLARIQEIEAQARLALAERRTQQGRRNVLTGILLALVGLVVLGLLVIVFTGPPGAQRGQTTGRPAPRAR